MLQIFSNSLHIGETAPNIKLCKGMEKLSTLMQCFSFEAGYIKIINLHCFPPFAIEEYRFDCFDTSYLHVCILCIHFSSSWLKNELFSGLCLSGYAKWQTLRVISGLF